MDPNATLGTLLDALENSETDDAREAATNLFAWIQNGGVRPDDASLFNRMVDMLIDSAI